MDFDQSRGRDRDFDRGSRDQDRGRDSDRGRDQDRRGRPSYDSDRRSRDDDRSRDDRSRRDDRGENRSRGREQENQKPAQHNGNEDERKAKRSRWSNDPESTSSSGLDDASKKLAKNTALEIAAKFANLAQVPENEAAASAPNIDKPLEEAAKTQEETPQEPEKPVVDITKADTADIATNVLGQLDDDDYDDEDDAPAPIKPPQPVENKPDLVTKEAITEAIVEPTPTTNDINTNGSIDTSEPIKSVTEITSEVANDKPNSELSAPIQGEENS